MPKMYSTSKGVQIDIDAFTAKHEKTRAVGNMNVNARGDLLDSKNKNIQSKNVQANKQYRKQIGTVVSDTPVYSSQRAAKRAKNIASEYSTQPVQPKSIAGLDTPIPMVTKTVSATVDPSVTEERVTVDSNKTIDANVVETKPSASGGLAAALAKARESKQEPLKTERQLEQEKPGVKRL